MNGREKVRIFSQILPPFGYSECCCRNFIFFIELLLQDFITDDAQGGRSWINFNTFCFQFFQGFHVNGFNFNGNAVKRSPELINVFKFPDVSQGKMMTKMGCRAFRVVFHQKSLHRIISGGL